MDYQFLLLFFGITIGRGEASLHSIRTVPNFANNIFAKGYPGLVISTYVVRIKAKSICYWQYGGEFDGSPWYENTTRWYILYGRSESVIGFQKTIDGMDYVASNLTFREPLTSSLNVSVFCDKTRVFDQSIEVEDCPSLLSYSVMIQSSSNTYGSIGIFGCSNNGKLFYSNGTELSTNQTTCLASAQWNGQDNLQCWTAPNVTLTGQLNVAAGSRINVSCHYVDVIPVASYSLFYFRNTVTKVSKGSVFTVPSVLLEDNKKTISCQAFTPFTRIYNESGRSNTHAINVLYNSFQNQTVYCVWKLNHSESCKVSFFSNPKPQFVSLRKFESALVNNDGENNISKVGDEHFQLSFLKKRATISDGGNYILVVRSSVFPQDSLILFTINVVTSGVSTAITPSLPVSEHSSGLANITIALGCVSVILLSAFIGLLVMFLRISCNNTLKHMEKTKQDAIESSYVETQQENLRTLEKNKPRDVSSDQYRTTQPAKKTTDITSPSAYLNEDVIPIDKFGYIDLNASSSDTIKTKCGGESESDVKKNMEDQQHEDSHKKFQTDSNDDGGYETVM